MIVACISVIDHNSVVISMPATPMIVGKGPNELLQSSWTVT